MIHLTVAYFSSRPRPMAQWFFDSLRRETGGDYENISVVIVDFWESQRSFVVRDNLDVDFLGDGSAHDRLIADGLGVVTHVTPKPTVWQGKYRRTKVDWFAAANARNTAICLAPDGWIAFVDDLSVLSNGWLARVRAAMEGPQKRITCGAYKKLKKLIVEDGEIVSFEENPSGMDNRLAHVTGDGPHECGSNWLYGCSLAAPVEAFLEINGFPEALCDGMGFEDVIAGIMLGKKGYTFVYDPRMMTTESDELHFQEPVMKRSDYGVSPNDKSHAILNIAVGGDGWHPNYFGEEGIRGLRKRVLAGDPFPTSRVPEHEWWTSTKLEDL